MSNKEQHPGKTAAMRKALDAIGCGDLSPRVSPMVLARMLDEGLIVHAGDRVVCHDRFGTVKVAEYVMPISVHMQWCAAVAYSVEEMAAFEAEMDALNSRGDA